MHVAYFSGRQPIQTGCAMAVALLIYAE